MKQFICSPDKHSKTCASKSWLGLVLLLINGERSGAKPQQMWMTLAAQYLKTQLQIQHNICNWLCTFTCPCWLNLSRIWWLLLSCPALCRMLGDCGGVGPVQLHWTKSSRETTPVNNTSACLGRIKKLCKLEMVETLIWPFVILSCTKNINALKWYWLTGKFYH